MFQFSENFPDEIHIDINLDPEEMSYLHKEPSLIPKRVTAANQVLPFFK